MNKIEEFERNLKVAYLNYENNDLKETLKYLDIIALLVGKYILSLSSYRYAIKVVVLFLIISL